MEQPTLGLVKACTPQGRFLTAQEQRFVLNYAQGMPLHAAAKSAGYAESRALAVLERQDVAETVAVLRKRMTERLGDIIDRDFVGAMILEAHKKAATATEELTAARDLAKLYGLNAPEKKVSLTYNVSRIEQLEALSDADLIRLAEADAQTLSLPEPVLPRPEETDDAD